MIIPRRKLGSGGLEVSAIGLGCMGMSEFYGPSDEATNLRVLNAALDIGVNFLDTADGYGVGANEQLLAKVLKTRRQEIVLATKFGYVRAPEGAFLGINGTPEYVRAACDASLRRLGVDHIDLYYQHRVDPKVAIEETVGAMAELVKAGKVLHLGLSEASAEHHSTRREGAPHHRVAERILTVVARPGGDDPARMRGTRYRRRRLQSARPRLSDRRVQEAGGL